MIVQSWFLLVAFIPYKNEQDWQLETMKSIPIIRIFFWVAYSCDYSAFSDQQRITEENILQQSNRHLPIFSYLVINRIQIWFSQLGNWILSKIPVMQNSCWQDTSLIHMAWRTKQLIGVFTKPRFAPPKCLYKIQYLGFPVIKMFVASCTNIVLCFQNLFHGFIWSDFNNKGYGLPKSQYIVCVCASGRKGRLRVGFIKCRRTRKKSLWRQEPN